ncbi:hypothetical protein VP01_13322g1 [Puccinia sorghi]|uniref:Uncharacterized protein n=1 Tax=Puccinia sorghi TaxID=27349 RepID=A0A0L6VMM0_9BASI|nr:hypothetical protein VP01_13322g1 [Puccinia sorghi]
MYKVPEGVYKIITTRHPNEKLSNKRFTERYWGKLTKEYNLTHIIENNKNESNSSNQDRNNGSSAGRISTCWTPLVRMAKMRMSKKMIVALLTMKTQM